jgi:nitrogen regulatory protein P-II 1
MKLILFVLNDPDKTIDVLNAWKEAGASGATVLFSTGMGRIHLSGALRDDLPLMPSLSDFYTHDEKLSRTLFTVLDDDSQVEKIIQATSQTVGDLDKPGTGILMVLPVDSVHGLIRYQGQPGEVE